MGKQRRAIDGLVTAADYAHEQTQLARHFEVQTAASNAERERAESAIAAKLVEAVQLRERIKSLEWMLQQETDRAHGYWLALKRQCEAADQAESERDSNRCALAAMRSAVEQFWGSPLDWENEDPMRIMEDCDEKRRQADAALAAAERRERKLRRAVLSLAASRFYGRMVDARIQRDEARPYDTPHAEFWDARARWCEREGDSLMRRARDVGGDGR